MESPKLIPVGLAFAAVYPIAHGNLLAAFTLLSMAVAVGGCSGPVKGSHRATAAYG